MKSRLVVPLAAIVLLAAGSVTSTATASGVTAAADSVGEKRGSVTRAEFLRIQPGMTRGKVQRIFGAGGGCAYVTYAVGEVRYVNRQYLQDNGLFTAVQYDTATDGRMRVRDIRFATQWNLAKVCS